MHGIQGRQTRDQQLMAHAQQLANKRRSGLDAREKKKKTDTIQRSHTLKDINGPVQIFAADVFEDGPHTLFGKPHLRECNDYFFILPQTSGDRRRTA